MVAHTLTGAQGLQWLGLMAIEYSLSVAAELMWYTLASGEIKPRDTLFHGPVTQSTGDGWPSRILKLQHKGF